jgi:hypothetical protein
MAHAMLQDADLPSAAIEQIFAPPIPVVLPAFEPNPLEPDATRPATGHADVTFAITKFGRARDVELHGATNASKREQRRLLRLIKKSRFRPQLTDGAFADSKPVSFRYYFHDERETQRADEPLSGEIRAAN